MTQPPTALPSAVTDTDATAPMPGSALNRESGVQEQIIGMQRWLLSRYSSYPAFPPITPDGTVGDRHTMNALVFALQHNLGVPAEEASIALGPDTRERIAQSGILGMTLPINADLTRVFQGALLMDGAAIAFTGEFDVYTRAAALAFQTRTELPRTGNADLSTWTGLLVSTGDLTRPTRAIDASNTITAERAATLVAAGYTTVGRYLTGKGKQYEKNELQTIFASGLNTFPIYQESNRSADDFGRENGERQGRRAAKRATQLGFPSGTVIFFAVDFDASTEQTHQNVMPYFRGIRRALSTAERPFEVGVYGPRAVCRVLGESTLTVASFVAGMSTGYLGNLGHPLPDDWWYDQIEETAIGEGNGRIGIDRNVMSSRARPVSAADMIGL
ncbi:MAG: glycoside hydrolase domain-containing protein [Mycetocola sp.]